MWEIHISRDDVQHVSEHGLLLRVVHARAQQVVDATRGLEVGGVGGTVSRPNVLESRER